jgi:hypothetical protein
MSNLLNHAKRLRFSLLAPSLSVDPRNNMRAAVYVEKRLIYNKIKKSGNSSVLLFLDSIVYGNQDLDSRYKNAKRSVQERTTSPFDLPGREIRKLDEYYKFTIFRNPYARCLSMFLHKVAPGRAVLYTNVPGFGDNSAAGFENFVSFLEKGGIDSNTHFHPQTSLLFFKPEYFSHIGKLENLDTELKRVCSDVGLVYPADLQASRPHRAEKGFKGKVTNANEKFGIYYTNELFDRVRDLYLDDFKIGGYDTQPPI